MEEILWFCILGRLSNTLHRSGRVCMGDVNVYTSAAGKDEIVRMNAVELLILGSELQFRVSGGFFHAGEDGTQFIEFRKAVEWFQARVGEHLKKPWAAGVSGGAQFR